MVPATAKIKIFHCDQTDCKRKSSYRIYQKKARMQGAWTYACIRSAFAYGRCSVTFSYTVDVYCGLFLLYRLEITTNKKSK